MGTVAYAFWSGTATGDATTTAATAAPLTVTAASGTAADLYPGLTVDLAFLLANGNGYPVDLTTLTAASVTSSDEGACKGSTYITFPSDVTTALATGGYTLPSAIAVPAGSTGTPATLSGFVTMTTSAPDACQGQTFTISLTFAGSQV